MHACSGLPENGERKGKRGTVMQEKTWTRFGERLLFLRFYQPLFKAPSAISGKCVDKTLLYRVRLRVFPRFREWLAEMYCGIVCFSCAAEQFTTSFSESRKYSFDKLCPLFMHDCREQASCRKERKSLLISGIGRRDGKNYEGERQERKLAGAFIVRRGRRK